MIDGGLIAARFVSYAALLLAAGLPLYLLCAPGDRSVTRRTRFALALLAILGAGGSVWWALAGVAAMTALPLSELDVATTTAVLEATPLGGVLAIRLFMLLGLALAVLGPWDRPRLPVAALFGAAALATCAWTGHAGASEGSLGSLHRLADIIHLLAAATWLGALVLLLAAALSPAEGAKLEMRLRGFATTGTVIVAMLVLSGAYNTLATTGFTFDPTLVTRGWGVILAVKLGLFAGMLALAGFNRWRLVPALAASHPAASQTLRRSLALECALGFAIVALVAVLGTLDPAG